MKRAPQCWIALAAATLALLAGPWSSADGGFLPAEKAFAYLVETEGDCLKVHWNVAPGYYLYRSRLSIESSTPGVAIGEARYPAGERHHDEYFGDQEVFRDDFTVIAPLTRREGTARELRVRLKWQGCADAGLCYPPTVWEAKVTLPEPQ